MDPGNHVEVVDRDGWRKQFPLRKPLLYIGAEAGNDIVLESYRGAGVSARHLQLIGRQDAPGGYRAVNLGDTELALGQEGERRLPPHSAVGVADGDLLRLGEFVLTFHLDGGTAIKPSGTGSASPSMRLWFSLPGNKLDAAKPLEGMITVRNTGRMPGVQFRLELEGLDEECYEMGSGPILFPNVEKGVYLRLLHPRRPDMPAGTHKIVIRATAPDAYPGESVTVSQEIEILPFYAHDLRLLTVD